MADHVLQRLQEEDKELCTHLINETRKNITSDPREFLLNFIHTEKEKAMLAEREALGNSFESLPSDAKELLFHPAMFMRKWIGEVCSVLLSFAAVSLGLCGPENMDHWKFGQDGGSRSVGHSSIQFLFKFRN